MRMWTVLRGLLLWACAMTLAACGRSDSAAPPPARSQPQGPVAELVARCDAVMGAGACRLMNGPAPPADGQVFVAGFGAVDAKPYGELRGEAAAMCGKVQRRCEAAWDGEVCRLARALYEAAPLPTAKAPR